MDMAVQRDDDKIIVLLSESRHLIFIARLSSRAFFSFCFQVLGACDNGLAGLEAGRTDYGFIDACPMKMGMKVDARRTHRETGTAPGFVPARASRAGHFG
jgi:hypothetical protein